MTGQGDALRRDRGRRQAGRHARAAAGADRCRSLPRDGRGPHRPAAGRQAVQGHPRRLPRRSCGRSLLVFAGISLFVGAFFIFNTFSITVAQRTREFALLRMLGANAPPGPALGAGRGADDRRGRLARRARARRRWSPAACKALFKADRRRPAVERHGHRDAHDRRVAGRRHGRHAGLDASPRRCGRRASRRSPRCARARQPPSASARAGRRRSRSLLTVGGVGLMALGLFALAEARRGAVARGRRRGR